MAGCPPGTVQGLSSLHPLPDGFTHSVASPPSKGAQISPAQTFSGAADPGLQQAPPQLPRVARGPPDPMNVR